MSTVWTAVLVLMVVASVVANGWLILEEREEQYVCAGVQR